MTKEQVLLLEHKLIREVTEWGSGQEQVFQGFISGVEAMTGLMLEALDESKVVCNGKEDFDSIH